MYDPLPGTLYSGTAGCQNNVAFQFKCSSQLFSPRVSYPPVVPQPLYNYAHAMVGWVGYRMSPTEPSFDMHIGLWVHQIYLANWGFRIQNESYEALV